jgi:hypothetical protein
MDIETEQEILRLLVGSHKVGRVAIKRHRLRSTLKIANAR